MRRCVICGAVVAQRDDIAIRASFVFDPNPFDAVAETVRYAAIGSDTRCLVHLLPAVPVIDDDGG